MYSDEEEEEEEEEEQEEGEYEEVPTRVVTTVPAKEPRLDVQPKKSALKNVRNELFFSSICIFLHLTVLHPPVTDLFSEYLEVQIFHL